MGVRGTLILALLIAAVGAYVWFEEAPSAAPGRSTDTLLGEPKAFDPNQPVRHLLEYQPADVSSIRLERGGQMRTTERSGETWTATSNPAAIADFLANLAQLAVVMDIPAGTAELRDYGLDPPQSVVRLQTRSQRTPMVLQIGDRNPSVTGVYVRIGEDGPVLLAGALVTWEFDKAFRALGPGEVN
jgi:uncharacterized protein DUF4340